MSFKEFTLWYWAVVSFVPALILLFMGWRPFWSPDVGLWYCIAGGVYAFAVLKEFVFIKKK